MDGQDDDGDQDEQLQEEAPPTTTTTSKKSSGGKKGAVVGNGNGKSKAGNVVVEGSIGTDVKSLLGRIKKLERTVYEVSLSVFLSGSFLRSGVFARCKRSGSSFQIGRR